MAQSIAPGHGVASRPGVTRRRLSRNAARRGWGAWLFLLIAAGLLILAIAGAVAFFEYRYAGLIYPGVQVAGIPLGGKSLGDASAVIRDGLTPYPGLPVVLEYNGRRWALSPQDLGIAIDPDATAALAFAVGRKGSGTAPGVRQDWRAYLAGQWNGLLADLSAQAGSLSRGRTIEPVVRFNDGQVNYQLKRITQDVDQAPREGSLTVSGLDVVAVPGKPGHQVDIDATRTALLDAARARRGGVVPLMVLERQPVVTSVDQAAAQARVLLSQPLTMLAKGSDSTQRFAVDRATLRQWLDIGPVAKSDGSVELKVQVKSDLVQAYLKQIAAQVNRPVQDAGLDFDPNTRQVKVVTPSQIGQALDVKAAAQAIETALAGDQRQLDLPVAILQPKVDMNKVSEMGITELVSEGTTGFAGSSSGRVKNIINAASKFNNVVVPPGEDFSFNRYVGDITAANGFVDSLIISGDRTEVGVGGGVCQVSTTAFQAAARGGFPIVERWAHSYVVGYYGKPGLDATIYTPNVDFRFTNDTGHYLLIKTDVNPATSKVTFRFYGTRPGRTVEISDPQITNVTPPPKAVYKGDKSLPAGTIKQVDWAVTGEDVVVVRTVRNADGTVKQDQFKSKYQPWRAVYLYGAGAHLPAGALDAADPGQTG